MMVSQNTWYLVSGITIGIFLITGFFSYAYGDETGEIHTDIPAMQAQEKSAKDMKMSNQKHEAVLAQVRKNYLNRMKKIQGKYDAGIAVAKKEKSKKKELVAKKIFTKAKAEAQKMYQKERNVAMKQAMKKK